VDLPAETSAAGVTNSTDPLSIARLCFSLSALDQMAHRARQSLAPQPSL
jgi:hypothetical protein